MKKTLEDFKNEIALEKGYKHWNTLYITKQWADIYKLIELANQRYVDYMLNDLTIANKEILNASVGLIFCLEEAPVDFLGTGSSCVDKEEKMWNKRWRDAEKIIEKYTTINNYE